MREGKARRQLVRYGRELWERRLVFGSSGNFSVRLNADRFLVTPSGACLRNLVEDDLVLVDRSGVAIHSQLQPTSELPLHLAAYAVRADIDVVLHTHPTFCVVWSKSGTVFPRDTVGARETLSDVAFTPFAPAGSAVLAQTVAAALAGGVNNVLMERHGLSCVGSTLEEAFIQTDLAEEAARIAYLSKIAAFSEGALAEVR